MTKTFLIHAWCLRPFITGIDVEAETPEQAIAKAREQQDKLLDAAEECNGGYAWDEFAAYDDSGNELLRVLDDQARLREAAPQLVEALIDLLGDRPSVQRGECIRCGRQYHDIEYGDCPSDDCPSFHARAALAAANRQPAVVV
jgi:hypothetical protein